MTDFDPRGAALQYAANVERQSLALADHRDKTIGAIPVDADTVHAIVCGLIYAGDQIRELNALAHSEGVRLLSASLSRALEQVVVPGGDPE